METTGQIVDLAIDFNTLKTKISLIIDSKDKDTINQLKNEEKLNIDLKKWRNKRSLDANAYFHLLVNKLARHFNLSDEDMKIKMNLEYGTISRFEDGTIKGCKVPKGTDMREFYKYSKWYKSDDEENDCYIFYKETHTLNTKEMSDLINGVVQECHDANIETLPEEEIESMLRNYDGKMEKN